MNEQGITEPSSPETSSIQINTSEDIFALRRSVENKGEEEIEKAFQIIKSAIVKNIREGATKIAQDLLSAATSTNFLNNNKRTREMKDSISEAANLRVDELLSVEGGAYNANTYIQSLRDNLVPQYFDSATINTLLSKIKK